MERVFLTTVPQQEYALLDCGEGEKLERYGEVLLARPDPQALWHKTLSQGEWVQADALYERKGNGGEWRVRTSVPKQWPISFGGATFFIRATSFKHTGLFPEQFPHWEWIEQELRKNPLLQRVKRDSSTKVFASPVPPKVLNLFGYTGGATLAAARAGAEVTHVDASKVAVAWARENAAASGLGEAPIRWIVEDALTFMRREAKRGVRYDGIIMDPPAFGHGPKKELWKIEEDARELFDLCEQLLSPEANFVLVSGYAAGYSPLAFAYLLEPLVKHRGGSVSCGDLSIAQQGSERVLPCGIFARWSR